MSLTLRPWRERPLDVPVEGDRGVRRFIEQIREAWNRELSPLLASMRQGLLDAEGVRTEITFDDNPHTVEASTKFLAVDATDGVVTVNPLAIWNDAPPFG